MPSNSRTSGCTRPVSTDGTRVHDAIIRDVARRYDRASAFRFADLPAEAQTVIADVAIQFGPDLADRERGTPRFWRFVTRGEWQAAIDELRDFGDRFAPRRRREARLLGRALNRLPELPAAKGRGVRTSMK